MHFIFVGGSGYKSSNFIIGLTNTDPTVDAPVLWQYTLCGQYPGTIPDGATVTVQCTNAYNRGLRFRYVIVQFPLINDWMNFCEIEVFAVGKPLIPLYYTLLKRKRTSLNNVMIRKAVVITCKTAEKVFGELTIFAAMHSGHNLRHYFVVC